MSFVDLCSFPSLPFSPFLSLLYLWISSLLLTSIASSCLRYSFFPLSSGPFHPTSLTSSSSFPHLLWFSLPASLRLSPGPDWWRVEVKQTDSGWGIAPASLWHWAPFKPGKWSMLNLILNTRSLTLVDRRRVEAGVWQPSWGILIRPTFQVYLQVFVCMCLFVCVAFLLETVYLKQEPSVLCLKGSWRVLLSRLS